MKKLTSIILIFIILLAALCGCQSNRESYKNEFDCNTDFQYYYSSFNSGCLSMTKAKQGYYIFSKSGFLYYIDKSTLNAVPLCDKVNCLHNDKKTCNAYFKTYSSPSFSENVIQYYNDELYMLIRNEDNANNFLGSSLCSVSADGVYKKELLKFNGEGFDSWIIHRGYFYYVKKEYSSSTDKLDSLDRICINRIPMDNLNEKPCIVFDSKNYNYRIKDSKHTLSAYKDYIVIGILSSPENQKDNSVTADFYNYYSFNTADLKVNQIQNKNGRVLYPTFYNDKLLYHINNSGGFDYYISDLNGSNSKYVKAMKKSEAIFSDGKHIYMQNLDEILNDKMKNSQNDFCGQRLYTLNSEFEKISSCKLPINSFSLGNIAQDDLFYFYTTYDNSNQFKICCIDKSDLDNGQDKIVKHKICFEEKQ